MFIEKQKRIAMEQFCMDALMKAKIIKHLEIY